MANDKPNRSKRSDTTLGYPQDKEDCQKTKVGKTDRLLNWSDENGKPKSTT